LGSGVLSDLSAGGQEGAPVRVAAVIPAFNEERTVGDVVSVLKEHPLVQQVVVVSDGSTDQTAAVARAHGAEVVELTENLGKGAAIQAGIERVTADVVLFLDADLIGLTPEHVTKLLRPVLSGESEMAIGLFDGGRTATDLAQAIAPYLSGQRALRRELLEGIGDLDGAGFGVELLLTQYVRKQRYRIKAVGLKDMTHQTKEEKRGLMRGFAARMKMYWEIGKFLTDSRRPARDGDA
jgi:glycosyltransferase involved in cell wall biosynthesis